MAVAKGRCFQHTVNQGLQPLANTGFHDPTSIAQRISAAPLSTADKRELLAVSSSRQTCRPWREFSQLRTDYNANATIATDTTATAITLNTTN